MDTSEAMLRHPGDFSRVRDNGFFRETFSPGPFFKSEKFRLASLLKVLRCAQGAGFDHQGPLRIALGTTSCPTSAHKVLAGVLRNRSE